MRYNRGMADRAIDWERFQIDKNRLATAPLTGREDQHWERALTEVLERSATAVRGKSLFATLFSGATFRNDAIYVLDVPADGERDLRQQLDEVVKTASRLAEKYRSQG
jgi:hypothetical protein